MASSIDRWYSRSSPLVLSYVLSNQVVSQNT
jgi:hypothetical protein